VARLLGRGEAGQISFAPTGGDAYRSGEAASEWRTGVVPRQHRERDSDPPSGLGPDDRPALGADREEHEPDENQGEYCNEYPIRPERSEKELERDDREHREEQGDAGGH
jgi:hypothetical protein